MNNNTVPYQTNSFQGNNKADWAKDLTADQFELLCLDGTRAKPGEYADCHLAEAPTHAVMTRPDKIELVHHILQEQQVCAVGGVYSIGFCTLHLSLLQ